MFRTIVAVIMGVTAGTNLVQSAQCPDRKQILLGMTYKEIKEGPCPDIDARPQPHADPFRPIYYCPSLHEMVIGDVRPGNSGHVISVSLYVDK